MIPNGALKKHLDARPTAPTQSRATRLLPKRDAGNWTGDDPGMKFFEGVPIFAAEVRSIYRHGEYAEAEPAVPGWQMPVDALFI
jgi:hypothetical protein